MNGVIGDILTTTAFMVVLLTTTFSYSGDSLVAGSDAAQIRQEIEDYQKAEENLAHALKAKTTGTPDMIHWLCTTRYKAEQRRMHVNWGDHPLLKEPERAKEIADAVDSAAQATGLEVSTILTIAWFESRLEKSVGTLKKKGSLGESGYMQCHGTCAKGCDFSTAQGQFLCGSKCFVVAENKCKSLKGAISFYATGKSCKAQGSVEMMVDRRLTLKRQLDSLEKEGVSREIASAL